LGACPVLHLASSQKAFPAVLVLAAAVFCRFRACRQFVTRLLLSARCARGVHFECDANQRCRWGAACKCFGPHLRLSRARALVFRAPADDALRARLGRACMHVSPPPLQDAATAGRRPHACSQARFRLPPSRSPSPSLRALGMPALRLHSRVSCAYESNLAQSVNNAAQL
jgi:hypothetical protein